MYSLNRFVVEESVFVAPTCVDEMNNINDDNNKNVLITIGSSILLCYLEN
jgi:hypothetical protein